ncbi:MAG: hypothetical protein JRH15_17760 [Deltaproteobacteria bacterium]|nr:hypothetical protein [Deltaproteobacteria bacterium]
MIGLIVLAGAVTWIAYRQSSHGMLSQEGDLLLSSFPLLEIAAITIDGPSGNVTLSKKTGRWVVKDRYDYPADFKQISDFVETLQAARIGRQFPVRADIRSWWRLTVHFFCVYLCPGI